MAAPDHGKYYWHIETTEERIWVFADDAEITYNGDLFFYKSNPEDFEDKHINFAFSKGTWIKFYAASVWDGGAIAVEHWDPLTEKGPVMNETKNKGVEGSE